ncbi:hypothetical protein ACFQZI_00145 [Mucilaginibacter lutimaris]|uniref:Uncharacterized protein n=1 Tax=Mucilaginibacter lutimaris TaxID=931629 RepID=A0ABW2ZCG6_9SPHI
MESKQQIISKLRQELLQWEGYKAPVAGQRDQLGLGPLFYSKPSHSLILSLLSDEIVLDHLTTAPFPTQ